MGTSIDASKQALRRQAHERLRAMTVAERAAASAQARTLLKTQPAWRAARSVMLYAPMPEELDVWPLLADGLKAGKVVALPRFVRAWRGHPARSTGSRQDARSAEAYIPCRVRNLALDIVTGAFGIREPAAHCAELPINGLDLILTPGLAFDLSGRRLGRGRGFYDQILAARRGTACGVAFDQQIVTEVPVAPHDVLVNCMLTPTRWIEMQGVARK
jgi:5-formyltetrahydrofolate cyclo-ligase